MKINYLVICNIFFFTLWAPGCAETVWKGPAQGPIPEIKKACTTCHLEQESGKINGTLKKPLSKLCLECHADRQTPAEHAVDIVPSMKAGKLPLKDGKMTCITCHDPHDNLFGKMLRVPSEELCQRCHKK